MGNPIKRGITMPLVWTQETLAAKSTEDIKTIRANAVAKQAQDVVALCDAELERRRPPKKPKQSAQGNRRGQYVSEFHFVCPNESEVKRDPSGTIRTGTWVVAEEHADAATKYGAVVALHVARAQPSYLQGTIKSWRKQPRELKNGDGELVGNEVGIEFEFEPMSNPLPWKGNATGERGYGWSPIPE